MVILCLFLFESTRLFSRVAVTFYVLTSNAERFSFSASSPAFSVALLFYFRSSDECIGVIKL